MTDVLVWLNIQIKTHSNSIIVQNGIKFITQFTYEPRSENIVVLVEKDFFPNDFGILFQLLCEITLKWRFKKVLWLHFIAAGFSVWHHI